MWKILDLKYKKDNGAVIQVISEYRLESYLDNKKIIERNIIKTELDEIDVNEDFIPFNDLTEEIVLAWVKSKIDYYSIELDVKSKIDNKISILNNNTTDNKLPWN
jgi:hypothetical protein